ncbi:MAG: phytanoyl-CoA dioxygenase family protein [bacterium]|nr:phytanoyl-CoA dioxygenase family protein [bacterium]
MNKKISLFLTSLLVFNLSNNAFSEINYEADNEQDAIQLLNDEGIVILRGLFSVDKLEKIHDKAVTLFNDFNQVKSNLTKSTWDYSYLSDRVHPSFIDIYTYANTDVLEIRNGRYDLAPLSKEHLPLDLVFNQKIVDLMSKIIGPECLSSYYGLLPSTPSSVEGAWHRDVMPLERHPLSLLLEYDEAAELQDLESQNYYFSVMIPLVASGSHNGGTVFIPKSHKITYNEMNKRNLPEFQPEVNVGDVIIFAGPLVHRGKSNPTNENRMLLYQTWRNECFYEHPH